MKPPAFQFYADDFLAGTMNMTDSEVGLYIRLLCAQWNNGGLPDDDDELLAYGKVGSTTVQPSLNRIRTKFEVCSDGKLRNKRLEAERDKQNAFRERQKAAGRKSGKARLNHGSTTVQPSLNGGSTKPQPKGNSPSPSPSPITEKGVYDAPKEPQPSTHPSRGDDGQKNGHQNRPQKRRRPVDESEALAMASRIGLGASEASAWYRDMEAADWRDREGFPLNNWPRAMTSYRDILADRRARFGRDKIQTPGGMSAAEAKARKELEAL